VDEGRSSSLRFNLELLPALLVLLFSAAGALLPSLGLPIAWIAGGPEALLSPERRLSLFGGLLATGLSALLHSLSTARIPSRLQGAVQPAAQLLAGTAGAQLAPRWAGQVLVYLEPGAPSRSFGGRGRGVVRLGGSGSDERVVELVHELAHLEASHPRKRLLAILGAAWTLLLVLVLAQPLVTAPFARELRAEGVLDNFRRVFDFYMVPIALVLAWPLSGLLRNVFHAQEFSADRALAPLTQGHPQLLRAQEQVLRQHPVEPHFPFDSHPSPDHRLEALRGGAGSDAERFLGAVHAFAAIVIALSLGLVGLLTNLLWVRVLAVDRSVRQLNADVIKVQQALGARADEVRTVLDSARDGASQYQELLGLGQAVPKKEVGSFPQLARDLHQLHQRLSPLDEQVESLGRDLGLDGERPGLQPRGLRLLRDQVQLVQPGLEQYAQGLGLLPSEGPQQHAGLLPGLSQRLETISAPTGPLASVEKALGSYLDDKGPYSLLWNRSKDLAERVERAGKELGLSAAAPPDAPLTRLDQALGGLAASVETLRGQVAKDPAAPVRCPDWRRLDARALDAEVKRLSVAERVQCLDQITTEALEGAMRRAQETLPPAQRPKAPPAPPADAGAPADGAGR
jgi:Peptidase family M48